jgi:imidazoleglycerol-phosphate dehydratase
MRDAAIARKTNETDVRVELKLDGSGRANIATGCGFLDHMLTLFAAHGRFDLDVAASGDAHVDFHHTVEDVGIVLGKAFGEALGDGRGVRRYGSSLLPMDEALVLAALDISGRAHLAFDLPIAPQKVGDFDTELAREFFSAMARSLPFTLHIRMLSGANAHHIIEAAFKGVARAMAQAVAVDSSAPGEVPSSKGTLL